MILKAAYSDSLILISGEEGTEKEHIARLIHTLSRGSGEVFFRVDCKKGILDLQSKNSWYHWQERARGGSLFINSIENLSFREQLYLKTILEKEIIGSGQTPASSPGSRLLLGASEDLAERVRKGNFLPALYYTMRVVEIMIPPLRLREEDILSLAYLVLESVEGASDLVFFPDVPPFLLSYSWPGNFDELSRTIFSAAESAVGTVINLRDLPSRVREGNLAMATS